MPVPGTANEMTLPRSWWAVYTRYWFNLRSVWSENLNGLDPLSVLKIGLKEPMVLW